MPDAVLNCSTDLNSYTAFAGTRRLGTGSLTDVARTAKAFADRGEPEQILIFNDASGATIEIDLRGTANDVVARLSQRVPHPAGSDPAQEPKSEPALQRRAGRPKLGVVGREVTLLPRHWDWLAEQPGGASVALRKLVEEARKANQANDLTRKVKDAAYRFIYVVAGNFPRFEAAMRALFAGDRAAFAQATENWPADVRDHARWLMAGGVHAGHAASGR